MAKRKAPYTKQALHEAARNLLREGRKINFETLSARLREEFSEDLARDKDDIFDIGLRVLCGRITTTKVGKAESLDMFDKSGLAEFFPLRVLQDGRVSRTCVLTRHLTPRIIDDQPPLRRGNQPKGNPVLKHIDEMRQYGMVDETLESFLNDKQ